MSGCVYIARNASGDVLYVGSTGDLPKRLAQHAKTKAWWSEVADVQEIAAESRAAAFDLERDHIQALCPKHNRTGVTAPKVVGRIPDGAPVVKMRAATWASLIEATGGPERLLADRLGVNHMTFSNYKRGVAFPSGKFIAAAIATSGLSFDELFMVEAPTTPPEAWISKRAARSHHEGVVTTTP